jgi:PAS domain-containing protein
MSKMVDQIELLRITGDEYYFLPRFYSLGQHKLAQFCGRHALEEQKAIAVACVAALRINKKGLIDDMLSFEAIKERIGADTFPKDLAVAIVEYNDTPSTVNRSKNHSSSTIRYINSEFERLVGYDRRVCIGAKRLFMQHDLTNQASVEKINEAAIDKELSNCIVSLQKSDGTHFSDAVVSVPLTCKKGRHLVFELHTDVTEIVPTDKICMQIDTQISPKYDVHHFRKGCRGEQVQREIRTITPRKLSFLQKMFCCLS